jgi:hypothetical protein
MAFGGTLLALALVDRFVRVAFGGDWRLGGGLDENAGEGTG